MRKTIWASWGVNTFALIWIVVLLVPALRREPWQAVRPNVAAVFRITPVWGSLQPFPDIESTDETMRLQAQFDRDAQLSNRTSSLAPLLDFAEQHPRVLWVQASALSYAFGRDLPVPLDPGSPDFVFESTHQDQTWFTPDALKHLIQIARRGAQQDAGNAYFPVIMAWCFFGAHREAEGWAALNRLERCSSFDSYAFEETRRRIKILEAIGPTNWNEKWAIFRWAENPYLERLWHFRRLICFRARQSRNSGNLDLAWRRYESALAIGRALRRSQGYEDEVDEGERFETSVWWESISADPNRLSQFDHKYQTSWQLASTYATVSRKWGAPALIASRSVSDAGHFVCQRFRDQSQLRFLPISIGKFASAISDDVLATSLAWTAWVAAIIWVVFSIPRRFSFQNPSPSVITAWTAFSMLCLFSAGAGLVELLADDWFEQYLAPPYPSLPPPEVSILALNGQMIRVLGQSFLFLWPFLVPCLKACSEVGLARAISRERLPALRAAFGGFMRVSSLLGSGLVVLVGVFDVNFAIWNSFPGLEVPVQAITGAGLIVFGAIVVFPNARNLRLGKGPLATQLPAIIEGAVKLIRVPSIVLAVLLVSVGIFDVNLAIWNSLPAVPVPVQAILGALLVVSASVAMFSNVLNWRGHVGAIMERLWPGCATFGQKALVLMGILSGRIALAASVAYVSCALVLYPLNTAIDHHLQDIENRGQVAVWTDELNAGY